MPIFMAYDPTSKTYTGYLIDVAGSPLEIEVLPGTPDGRILVVFRRMGGPDIHIHTFLGPTPKDVVRQLTELTGRPKSALPPWVHGIHVCRRSGAEENDFLAETRGLNESQIPYESDCIGQSLLQTGFRTNQAFIQLQDDFLTLKTFGKRFLLHQPPTSELPEDFDGFIKTANGSQNYVTSVRAGERFVDVVVPDFLRQDTQQWYSKQLQTLFQSLQSLGGDLSGINLIQNSPLLNTTLAEACGLTGFPFAPVIQRTNLTLDVLGVDTLCPDAQHLSRGKMASHVNYHNTFARRQATATVQALQTVIFSENSSPGMSESVAVIPRMDNKWAGLKKTLKTALELSLSGIPYFAVPTCGNEGDDELCLRWVQVSAFMPTLYALNGYDHLVNTTFSKWSRHALRKRLELMPYILTLSLRASRDGEPLVRPLIYEFPQDPYLTANSTWQQFMLGSSILVSPILEPDTAKIAAYFPQDFIWYNLWSGTKVTSGLTELETSVFQIPAHLKCGSIISTLVSSFLISAQNTF